MVGSLLTVGFGVIGGGDRGTDRWTCFESAFVTYMWARLRTTSRHLPSQCCRDRAGIERVAIELLAGGRPTSDVVLG